MIATNDHAEETVSDSAALGRLAAILADSGIAFSVRPATGASAGFAVAVGKAERRRLSRAITAATRPAEDLEAIAARQQPAAASPDPRQFAKIFGPPGDQILVTMADDTEEDCIKIQTFWNSRVPGLAICSMATQFTNTPGSPYEVMLEEARKEFHAITEDQARKKVDIAEAEYRDTFCGIDQGDGEPDDYVPGE